MAGRVGIAQGVRGEEGPRLGAEIKKFRESIEARLAESDRKTSLVLNILLRMKQQQNKEMGVETYVL